MSKLLINEHPMMVLPSLALAIGLEQALVLQQIHYWIEGNRERDINEREGRYWVYNTHDQWQEEFGWWSKRKVQRILKKLRDLELVDAKPLAKDSGDRTLWYTIDYEELAELESLDPSCQNGNMPSEGDETPKTPPSCQNGNMGKGDPSCQSGNIILPNRQDASCQSGKIYKETETNKTETTTEKKATAASAREDGDAGQEVEAARRDARSWSDRYEAVVRTEAGPDFLQGAFELYGWNLSDHLADAYWKQIRERLEPKIARRYVLEKLPDLKASSEEREKPYTPRSVASSIRDDAADWREGHVVEQQVGKNPYDDHHSPQAERNGQGVDDGARPEGFPLKSELESIFKDGGRPQPWQSALETLAEQMSSYNFESWVVGLVWHGIDNGSAQLIAGDEFLKAWVEDNYLDLIEDALCGAYDGEISGVDVLIPGAVNWNESMAGAAE